jgi:hypothetical protein
MTQEINGCLFSCLKGIELHKKFSLKMSYNIPGMGGRKRG